MSFRVLIETPASAEIEAVYLWLAARSPRNAARWYHGLMEALATLRDHPARCALARESRHFDVDIRQLLYGRGKQRYRALFIVRGETIHVLHFRHGAQAGMPRKSIRFPTP